MFRRGARRQSRKRAKPDRHYGVWTLAILGALCVVGLGGAVIAHGAPTTTNIISTVAGTHGARGSTGDGGPATVAKFKELPGVAATADGGFLVVDEYNNEIRKVSPPPNSIVTRIAGDSLGTQCQNHVGPPAIPPAIGPCGDNGLARDAQLTTPTAVAEMRDGSILIADTGDQRIRMVSPAGVITTVAGDGTPCSTSIPVPNNPNPCGDGLSAITSSQLNDPLGVAAERNGGFLIADSRDQRIREVSAAGTITTVAGNGILGLSPATSGSAAGSRLNFPTGVAVTAAGGFLIADFGNHVVREVSPPPNATITRVAGSLTGAQCTAMSNARPRGMHPCGDGLAATAAQLNGPTAVAETPDGDILIADDFDQRIRKVVGGIITTVAGTGASASTVTGNGGLAVNADLSDPDGVAATPDGGFLIADRGHYTIRRVTAPSIQTGVFIANDADRCVSSWSGRLVLGHQPLVEAAMSSNTALVRNDRIAITSKPFLTFFTATATPFHSGTTVLSFKISYGERTQIARVTFKVGNAGPSFLAGTPGSDIMLGVQGNDALKGGAGVDLLCGGPGNDSLGGNDGRDILEGGSGDDSLVGGAQGDRFRGGTGVDRALDFKPAEGDTQDGTIP